VNIVLQNSTAVGKRPKSLSLQFFDNIDSRNLDLYMLTEDQ